MSTLLRKGVLIPAQGVDWSLPSTFIPDQSGFSKNVRFLRNEMVKRPGKTVYGDAITGGQIMGLSKLELNTGTKILVRNSKTKMQRYNTSTAAWQNLLTTDFNGGDDDYFSYTNVTESGLLILTNGKEAIRKYDGASAAISLGGNPPKAKFVAYLSPYLLLGHVDDGVINSPWKVQWSDTGDPQVWNSGNAGSLLLSDEPSPIKNMMKLNNYMAVYKEESLWLLQKVSTFDIFIPVCIKTGMGLASSRCLVEAEGQHYFMGVNDFYVWNGGNPESFGRAVRDELFNRINRNKIDRCFGLHIHSLKEIWFFIVISGESWPTEIWKYSYLNGYWYFDTCSSLTSAILWEKTAVVTWDDMVGTWDATSGNWDARSSSLEWEQIVFGDSNGNTSVLDYATTNDLTVPVESIFESKDFTGDQLEFNKRWLQIDIWAKGSQDAKLTVDFSINYGVTWQNVQYKSTSIPIILTPYYQKYSLYFDTTSDVIRFRFKNSESNEVFYIRNFYPYYRVQEQVFQ